jgi:hypothetical protein
MHAVQPSAIQLAWAQRIPVRGYKQDLNRQPDVLLVPLGAALWPTRSVPSPFGVCGFRILDR